MNAMYIRRSPHVSGPAVSVHASSQPGLSLYCPARAISITSDQLGDRLIPFHFCMAAGRLSGLPVKY